jgi:uncharacterized membrane protein
MTPLFLIGVSLLLISNAGILYFVISTWYGQKKSKMIAYTIDKDGKIKFDLDSR